MANFANSIRVKRPRSNSFNLSHQNRLTMKAGKLVPILVQECLPGDHFRIGATILSRFAPFRAPIMNNIDIKTDFYFVPTRLIWDKFKEFITGGDDGQSVIPYPLYKLQVTDQDRDTFAELIGNSSLLDYIDMPSANGYNLDSLTVDALPFRAYQLIWNEYYRDQNLQESLEDLIPENIFKGSGTISLEDTTYFENLFGLRSRAWAKDYFTSALPWPQRGPEVELPLQGNASIDYTDNTSLLGDGLHFGVGLEDKNWNSNNSVGIDPASRNMPGYLNMKRQTGDELQTQQAVIGEYSSGYDKMFTAPLNKYHLQDIIKGVNMNDVSSATINELRRAIKTQEFLEARARGGSRYIEQILSIFGVRSSDARLQRPEYLGGGRSPVVISDVLQTSQTTETSPQGQPSGTGTGIQGFKPFHKFCEEHGYIIGICSVMPKAGYFQGMPRKYLRRDPLDYYWPQFAHLGEQDIKNAELFFDYSKAYPSLQSNQDSFGYTPRYSEYRYNPDTVHGDFRGNLDFWTMARKFDKVPNLNADFITNVESAFNHPFAVQDADFDKIWMQIQFNIRAKRPLPKYGTPFM